MKKKTKQTEIGEIPKEWEVVEIGSLVKEIKNGFASGERDENGIVQIRMNNVTTDGRLIFDSYLKVPIPEKLEEFLLKRNDFLFNNTNSAELVGKSTVFENAPFDCTFSNHFTRIRFNDRVLPLFILYHALQLWQKGYFRSVAIRHVGQAAVHPSYLLKAKIGLPPFWEIKNIVRTINSVDEAIQKVDKAIEKTERLKKGLMQELLTKGIGHKEFKKTEIGRIPKAWEVKEMREVAEINKENRDPTQKPDSHFLYVDIESVENGTGIIKDAKRTLGRDAPSRAKRVIHTKDVIMSTVRPYLKAFALVPEKLDNQICSTGFAVLTSKANITPYYLLYTLFFESVIEQCNQMMMGGQYPALNSSQVAKIKIVLPALTEQQKIVPILSKIDNKLILQKSKKQKLEKIKRGLMNELLTGKKRIKV